MVVRDAARAGDLTALADDLGVGVTVLPFRDTADLRSRCADAAAVVSTVPASAAAALADAVAGTVRLVDAIYAPWPTPLAEAVVAGGGAVAGGLVMLLHQAFAQVEAFTNSEEEWPSCAPSPSEDPISSTVISPTKAPFPMVTGPV